MRARPAPAFIAVLPALLALWLAGVLSAAAQTGSPESETVSAKGLSRTPVVFQLDLEAGWNKDLPPGASRLEVIARLSAKVSAKASALAAFLREGEGAGLVSHIRVLWIAGAVSAEVAPRYLARPGALPGVKSIRPDPVLVPETFDGAIGASPDSVITETLKRMKIPEVWNSGVTGKEVVIASLDSGVFHNHSDLSGQIWANPGEIQGDLLDNDGNGFVDDVRGWNFAANDNNPADGDGHGTLVAGLAVGDGSGGTKTGAAPDARLMILRRGFTESSLWAASQYAVENGARIIMQAASYRWSLSPRPDYPTWRTVTENELAAGVIRFNSSGNNGTLLGDNPVPYNVAAPANCPPPWLHPQQAVEGGLSSAIAVANVELGSEVVFPTSAQGPSEWVDIQAEVDPAYPYAMPPAFRDYPYEPGISQGLLKPDLAAYGHGSISTAAGGGYSNIAGTSAATGHLAGIAALLLEARPAATPAMVAEALFRGAADRGPAGWDPLYGAGLVNAQDSLAWILQPCLGGGNDIDGDGICGAADNCPAQANPGQEDLDADGGGDACDADDDGDTIPDQADNCPAKPNPGQADLDSDLVGNACDNCPAASNPDQTDADQDGAGEACDCAPDNGAVSRAPGELVPPIKFESDALTLTWEPVPEAQRYHTFKGRILNGRPFDYNHTCLRLGLSLPSVVDLGHPAAGGAFYYLAAPANCFGDGPLGNASAGPARPGPAPCSDLDADAVADSLDNCPELANPGQEDADFDGTGEACEGGTAAGSASGRGAVSWLAGDGLFSGEEDDTDQDTVPDQKDNCPGTPNPLQEDADGDGAGNACDCAPADGEVFGRPGALGPALRLDADRRTVAWDPLPAARAYSVFKGRLDPGQSFSYGNICLFLSVGETSFSDPARPRSGGLHYYLVAAENCFGRGLLGFDAAGAPIPEPAACPDADGDQVGDPVDNCRDEANADQADSDLDGSGDPCDRCPADAANDADADGACAGEDNCPGLTNPGQEDLDADGAGDSCDLDDDGDGRPDTADNCPRAVNAQQEDADQDGWGDPCDPCPLDSLNDADADGWCSPADNCPVQHNPSQEDADGDSLGDPCDTCPFDPANDDDLDGACADADLCPGLANPGQSDLDGDRRGDACDCAPLDAAVFQAPETVGSTLLVASDRVTLTWEAAPDAQAWSVFKGRVPAGELFTYRHTCFARDLVLPTAADPAHPGRGSLFYYLVQAGNCFGKSDPGLSSDGVPRPAVPQCPDADQDGVADLADNCPVHSNPQQEDADWDDLGDSCDACPADPENDGDADGACGNVDNCPGLANPGQADADLDGTGDACDACPEDPENDGDADGACGNADNCPGLANPGQADADLDGTGDVCDACPEDALNDADLDGRCAGQDNCPGLANPGQADADLDGTGDVCDACPADPENDGDADGACGNADNCPGLANPGQADADLDGTGDACDACPEDALNDADLDGRCADQDNCPEDFNPGQEDFDGDGTGDPCDPTDSDADGVRDPFDNCPQEANPDQADLDGDHTGDVCDPDRDGDGFPDLADNCPLQANPGQEDQDGDGTGDVCDPDRDGDQVPNIEDNCPLLANPAQADFDGDGNGDACDADNDGDQVADAADNCPAAWNPGQEDVDQDGTGDACENDGVPQIAVVKWPQAMGVWLVGTPYEKAGTLLSSRWKISTADGADFDSQVIWQATTGQAPLTEIRALFAAPQTAGTLYARVAYRDAQGWSAESATRSWTAVPLPVDDGHLGARPGTVEWSDTFDGPDCSQTARADNLDRGGNFWPPGLAEPTMGGEYFTLGGRAALHARNAGFARAQTAISTQNADSFATVLLDPAPAGQNAYFDFSFGLRASGIGTNHQSYRCKVERLTDRDTIHFNKYTPGAKGKNIALWNGDLGPPPWRVRFEAVTIGAQGNAVRLSAYLWNGESWELATTFVDNGASGEPTWDNTPRILVPGRVVISNEKAGQVRYLDLRAGSIGSGPSPRN